MKTLCTRCGDPCEKVRVAQRDRAVCLKCQKQRERERYIIRRTIKQYA